MRKLLTTTLTIMLAITSTAIATPVEAMSLDMPAFLHMQANIIEADEEYSQIMVRGAVGGETVMLNISSQTFVVDALTGQNTTLAKRIGDKVDVYYSSANTHSYLQTGDALAVLVNIPPGYLPPWFHIADRIAIDDNEDLRVLVDNDGVVIKISGDTNTTTSLTTSTGQETASSQLTEGSPLLMWYETVALSYPAQATASRVVLLIHED